MTVDDSAQDWIDLPFTSRDGLALYGRRYRATRPGRRPLLCLPGLSRNCRDFHDIAMAMARHPIAPREVYCVDYRGRGRSAYDRNWRNYVPFVEMQDVIDFMTVAGIHHAAVLGTSRGGIIAMLMASFRPGCISVAVLNDIGPELQTRGLARIMGYIGRTPVPANWEEAADIVEQINGAFFPLLSKEDWRGLARQWFNDKDGRPVPAYDARLARAVGEVDLAADVPDMWPQFMALSEMPTLVIRGENSDLLSEATLEAMTLRHPLLHSLTVEGEGHAPLLRDAPTINAISEFLAALDEGRAAGHQPG